MSMNTAEQEVIGLCIALEAVNDIVNRALLDVRPVASVAGEAEVYFKSHVHQEMFLVRLLDFSMETGTKSVTGISGSCLDVLSAACSSKSFNASGTVVPLADSVTALQDWLEGSAKLKLWIPTLEIDAEISVPRDQLVFILGNRVKHNLARLTGVSRKVGKVLRDHGHPVEDEQVALALDDIREHLQENYFVYYGTWLAELINNVRWGLQDYLTPVFQQSYVHIPGDEGRCEYRYPPAIVNEVAREWFWRLMNHTRSRPYIGRFVGAHYLKQASSIEAP